MPTTEELIDVLLSRVEGHIAACNIVAGVEHGVIERDLVVEAFSMLARLAEVEDLGVSRKLVDALDVLQKGDYPPTMDGAARAPAMRLRGPHALTDGDFPAEVAAVFPVSTLRYIVPDEKVNGLMALGLSLAAKTSDPPTSESRDAVALLRQKPADWRRVQLEAKSSLGPPANCSGSPAETNSRRPSPMKKTARWGSAPAMSWG